jgi:hypothetical protein
VRYLLHFLVAGNILQVLQPQHLHYQQLELMLPLVEAELLV